MALELAIVQGRCTSHECCAPIISDLESWKIKNEETTDKLRSQLERLQNKGQAMKKAMERFKHQCRKKESMHMQQLALRKSEYCELERDLDEVRNERDSLDC